MLQSFQIANNTVYDIHIIQSLAIAAQGIHSKSTASIESLYQ